MNDRPLQRRYVLGMASIAGVSLAASPARALLRGFEQDFRQASRVLAPYGIGVSGSDLAPYDLIRFDIRPLPATAYTQYVKDARTGVLSSRTAVIGGVSSFEHFHDVDGNAIPCIKTRIEEAALATHEVFDEGSIIPCVRVTSEMLEGARIGQVDFEHLHEHSSGEIVPCVRTTIHDHALATHELFDDGALDPCVRVTSEMLEGARIGQVDFEHLHADEKGEYIPCVKTTIHDHVLATHELFDHSINPCWRSSAEMLEGGHIGKVVAEHLHETEKGGVVPCIRTTIHDHALATHEIIDGGETSVEVVTEMLDGGKIGAIDVLVSDLNAELTLRIGKRTYVLKDGTLVEV
jgi:hypothetical protein